MRPLQDVALNNNTAYHVFGRHGTFEPCASEFVVRVNQKMPYKHFAFQRAKMPKWAEIVPGNSYVISVVTLKNGGHVRIKVASSQSLYLYTIFDQRRVDIVDHVECGVHNRLHICPLCGIF